MSDSKETAQIPGEDSKDEPSFLELLIVLAKHKVLIAKVTLSVAIASVVISLLLPNIYTGKARVLPPQQAQSTANLLLGQLGGLANIAGNSLGIKNPSDLYVGMLKSRTVGDGIINRFDLKTIYDRATMVEVRIALENKTTISAGRDGLITIEFDDKDPQRAAAVANAYVEELQKLTQSLAVTEAGQRRLFFEQQLKQAKTDLSNAEVAFKTSQERTGVIKLDDQGRAIIEAVAALRAQVAMKEVELRTVRSFATEQNPDVVRSQQQLAGLRAQLNKLERAQVGGDGDLFVPTGKVPEVGLEYLRGFRDVKYYEAMFELLAKQFELAKIDEARETGVIQVVDQAIPPDRKSKPKRALIVIAATVLAGFIAVAWAFLREMKERAKHDPLLARRLATLRQHSALRRTPKD
jgi:tyrosine-protein kinase Etk/Wzc